MKYVAIALLLVATSVTNVFAAEKNVDKLNVLIVFTDDQGTLDGGCYGAPRLMTPNMDRLAKEGVRFTQAYSHTVCCPARAMLVTGRYPQRSGVINWTQGDAHLETKGRNMALGEVTIAEAFKKAGYATGMFGKWHLGAHDDHAPQKQGFDEYFGFRGGFIDNNVHYFLHGTGFHDLYDGAKEVFHPGKFFPRMTTDRALAFIEKNRDKPFLLYYASNLPHYPEQCDKKFEKTFADWKGPGVDYARALYTVDAYVGELLDKLEKLDLRKKTIVIYMSDNGASRERCAIGRDNHKSGLAKGSNYGPTGWGGYTGKWIGQKGSFLEGGIRVPAIISCPAALPQGKIRDQAITAMDWYPTVLQLCNVPAPEGVAFDGKSLVDVITKDAPSPHAGKPIFWAWSKKWVVRLGDWKLLGAGQKPTQLVSIADENPEEKNYLDEKPELVAELFKLHKAWAVETASKHQQ